MKNFLVATAAIMLIASPALAQQSADSTSTSGSQSGAVAGANNSNSTLNGDQTTVVAPVNTGNSSANSGSNSNAETSSISGSISQGGAGGDSSSTSQGGAATGGTANAQGGSASAAANPNANNAGNAQNITFNSTAPTKQTVKSVPSTYAPALTTTLTETCMGSTSVGGSGVGFGFSVGSTWEDKQCIRRLNAREIAQTLGDRDAARALMCQDNDVAAAYAAVGQSCFTPVVAYVAPLPPVADYAAPSAPEPPHPDHSVMAPIPDDYPAKQPRH